MENSLEKVKHFLDSHFDKAVDFVTREFDIFLGKKILLAYVSTMAGKVSILDSILKSFVSTDIKTLPKNYNDIVDYSLNNIITTAGADVIMENSEILDSLLRGDCLIFFENEKKIIRISVKGYAERAISEPPNSSIIRGPREGFTEGVSTNIMLLRKRIHSTKFKAEELSVGEYTKTKIALCYIEDIADPKIIQSIKEKLKSIKVDAIHDSFYIQKYLESQPYSMFKQVGSTEKPDIASAKIMEGRIAIIVDNSPMVLTVPFMMFENFQDSEDYYARKQKSDYSRILRLISVFIAVCAPAIHVAVMLHDFNVVPLKYLNTLINAVADMPVSPVIEMLLVLFLFDLLHEASVRMPRSIGLALNVVGALVLGETAVKSGLVSPPSVIWGAISGIGLFAVPEQGGSFSLLRLLFVLIGAVWGLYGVLFAVMFLMLYFASINAFGTPYLAPFAPLIKSDLQDGILREETLLMISRPDSISHLKDKRVKSIPENIIEDKSKD